MAMPLFWAFLNVIILNGEYPLQESWKRHLWNWYKR